MRQTTAFTLAAAVALTAALAPSGCTRKTAEPSTYFERSIAPILESSCARSSTGSGCHVSNAKGNAFGNLDVSSYAAISLRRDLFAKYGPYEQPAFLLKVVPPSQLRIEAHDGTLVTTLTDVKHAGGQILDPSQSAFQTLRRWIDNGAWENNAAPAGDPPAGGGACTKAVPALEGFDPTLDPPAKDFATFRDRVAKPLAERCGAGSCHGAPSNELFFTCADTPEGVRDDYFRAVEYLGQTPDGSELARRPLAPSQGGSFHEGGVFFQSAGDPLYQAILEWAKEHGPPDTADLGAGFAFFSRRVQPVLARKGCMQIQCHSGISFHDYRLRGGSGGSFSFSATRKNYKLSLLQVALQSDAGRASRLLRKNLYRPEVFPTAEGITHRGGALLEDFGGGVAADAACDAAGTDYENGNLDTTPGYCVIREWIRRERAARPALAPLRAIAYVRRDLVTGPDRVQDFDVYQPGSELRLADATLDATGAVVLGADRSVNADCGLAYGTADVKRPQASWDGAKIAFAARSSADEGLRVYEMNADGTGCAIVPEIAAGPHAGNGLLVHDFDPAYGMPDRDHGGTSPLVFASTRGNLATAPYDYAGPQRTPADPSKPNSNLYALEADKKSPAARVLRQITYLLNTERMPAFMADGRLIFTVEKRLPGFYMLSGRRINVDGGDYHPLFGQRESFGYREVSQMVHLSDKNFAAILADAGIPHRGGVLAVFNRSIGVDFRSANAADYRLDPGVIDPASPSSPEASFFLRSMTLPDPSSTGRLTGAGGLYTSPAPLPDGQLLVSWADAPNAPSFAGDYDLYVLNPARGVRTRILGEAGKADIEAVGVFGRPPREVYKSRPSEPNAYGMEDGKTDAELLVHDMPVIASLMTQNTPTIRELEPLESMQLWEELPPAAGVTSFADGGAHVVKDAYGQVYVRRRLLGTVKVGEDGSTRFRVPGGVPLLLQLGDTDVSRAKQLPRLVNEHFQYTPGERVHEAFTRNFFNGFCGNCHGATSGRAIDLGPRADVMSGASGTAAQSQGAQDLNLLPAQRGPIVGP